MDKLCQIIRTEFEQIYLPNFENTSHKLLYRNIEDYIKHMQFEPLFGDMAPCVLASRLRVNSSSLFHISWWRHQMETFSALLALCAGNSLFTGEFPSQRPVTRSFDVFFDLRLNKRLHKQLRGWSFETPSRSLWRHCNVDSKDHRQVQCESHNECNATIYMYK